MKYTISRDCTFGWDFTVYDTETMTRTRNSGCGDYGSTQSTEMTEEEMRQFINNRELSELKNFHYEIKRLKQRYDEKFEEIEKFKKALDNR
jgi:hypothetical protein